MRRLLGCVALLVAVHFCVFAQATQTYAQWARTVTGGKSWSRFTSAAADGSGNLYVAGVTAGNKGFGAGVEITSPVLQDTALLVKYDSSGAAQWARAVHCASLPGAGSLFWSVATDAAGNSYAAGFINGKGAYDFGNGVTIVGVMSGGAGNPILTKYNSAGLAQWARTATTSTVSSILTSAAADSYGNVYAAGYFYGASTISFGANAVITGPAKGFNGMLVKYDSSGKALWARAIASDGKETSLVSVATDPAGNVYVSGLLKGTGPFDFGSGITATGPNAGGYNAVLIKYDASGRARWASVPSSAPVESTVGHIAVDSYGQVYVPTFIASRGVLLKYAHSGVELWRKPVTGGKENSGFGSVFVDSFDSVFATGRIWEKLVYGFGNNVTAAGPSGLYNPVLVKFDAKGYARWAETTSAGYYYCDFGRGVFTPGGIYVAGSISGDDTAMHLPDGTTVVLGKFDFGNNVTVTGCFAGENGVFVKYQSPVPAAEPVFTPPGGVYASDQAVTISCQTSGATIYYTIDGTTPGTSSRIYSSPIQVKGAGSTTTIKAYAVKSGMTDSRVSSSVFAVRDVPPQILFTSDRTGFSEIYVMNADGSGQSKLSSVPGTNSYSPSWSPDGKRIAFNSTAAGRSEIYLMDADGSNRIKLPSDPGSTNYSPSWSPAGTGVAFESKSGGSSVIETVNIGGTVPYSLPSNASYDAGSPTWSPNGTRIAYRLCWAFDHGYAPGVWQLYVMSSDGSDQRRLTSSMIENRLSCASPAWSPDGMKIAFTMNHQICVINADGSGLSQLTNTPGFTNDCPTWSPDGTQIAFQSNRDGHNQIYVMRSNGAAQTRLTWNAANDSSPCWRSR